MTLVERLRDMFVIVGFTFYVIALSALCTVVAAGVRHWLGWPTVTITADPPVTVTSEEEGAAWVE